MNIAEIERTFELSDGGPVYFETNLQNFIVEPWNAFSSLTIVLPAIYFLIKLYGKYRNYAFVIYFCCPLLLIGGFGSTFYHAFRSLTIFVPEGAPYGGHILCSASRLGRGFPAREQLS